MTFGLSIALSLTVLHLSPPPSPWTNDDLRYRVRRPTNLVRFLTLLCAIRAEGLDQRPTSAQSVGGVYPMTMKREPSMIVLICLSAVLATPTLAQSILGDNYNIMVPEKGYKPAQPEPWLAPKYRSPLGTEEQVRIPKPKTVRPRKSADPGYVYVPQTGRTFQNLPTLPGSGPGGAETSQDRRMNCIHQAGVYGQIGGSYMGACF